jgi:aryl-alcohol dehydrogenase-like predicted oxidoreductase
VDQLKDLVAAAEITLTPEEVAAVEKPYQPHRILGHAQPSAKALLK